MPSVERTITPSASSAQAYPRASTEAGPIVFKHLFESGRDRRPPDRRRVVIDEDKRCRAARRSPARVSRALVTDRSRSPARASRSRRAASSASGSPRGQPRRKCLDALPRLGDAPCRHLLQAGGFRDPQRPLDATPNDKPQPFTQTREFLAQLGRVGHEPASPPAWVSRRGRRRRVR